MNADSSSPDQANATPKPVAYDSEGRPLYAAPPAFAPEQPPVQMVQMVRPAEPAKPEISPEVQSRHDESVTQFPSLNLSESEFIISAVRRHPIGLIAPVAITGLLVVIMLLLLTVLPSLIGGMVGSALNLGPLFLGGVLLIVLFLIGGYISIWVYMNNRFFLTNESVIQEIQSSLFSHHEQTVSLANIEDASYEQRGILQALFNYGSIRLSTEGDETTYRFSYVAEPKKQIAILNNAVEAFKNGRPVDLSD